MDIAFHLYSARNFPPVLDMLPKLKALGYSQVEGYGGLYAASPDFAQRLADNGLTMPTGHFGLDMLQDVDGTLKIVENLGTKVLFCPAVPLSERGQDADGWKRLAETLARLGETYNKAGYGFGWHNHNFEFVPTTSGEMPMELILENAPGIVWECDVAWVAKGNADPVGWIERYKSRLVAIHVKDIARVGTCLDEDGWADVGHGTMDWSAILKFVTENTDCAYFVAEHDNPNDVDRFARRSIEYIRSLGY